MKFSLTSLLLVLLAAVGLVKASQSNDELAPAQVVVLNEKNFEHETQVEPPHPCHMHPLHRKIWSCMIQMRVSLRSNVPIIAQTAYQQLLAHRQQLEPLPAIGWLSSMLLGAAIARS
jgi:hypothetical protein